VLERGLISRMEHSGKAAERTAAHHDAIAKSKQASYSSSYWNSDAHKGHGSFFKKLPAVQVGVQQVFEIFLTSAHRLRFAEFKRDFLQILEPDFALLDVLAEPAVE